MAEAKKPREQAAGPAPTNKERRNGDRLRSHTLADGKLRDPKGRMTSFLGSTIDVSLGGTQVRTYEPLEPGVRVVLNLRLPEGDVAATGTVVHVAIDPIGCRLAGIRFDPLVSDAAELLSKHLREFLPHLSLVASNEAIAAKPVATIVPVTGRVESHGAKG